MCAKGKKTQTNPTTPKAHQKIYKNPKPTEYFSLTTNPETFCQRLCYNIKSQTANVCIAAFAQSVTSVQVGAYQNHSTILCAVYGTEYFLS